MIMAGFGIVAILIALFIWDLAGQPTGRRWRRRLKRRSERRRGSGNAA